MAEMTYPQYICHNCFYLNQLDFDPKENKIKLLTMNCEDCGQYAYWSHYFTAKQILAFVWDRSYIWDIIPHKFGRLHGRKKPHSVSV